MFQLGLAHFIHTPKEDYGNALFPLVIPVPHTPSVIVTATSYFLCLFSPHSSTPLFSQRMRLRRGVLWPPHTVRSMHQHGSPRLGACGAFRVLAEQWCAARYASTCLSISVKALPDVTLSSHHDITVVTAVPEWPWIATRKSGNLLVRATHYPPLFGAVAQALDAATDTFNILLTGHPGIGKTFGALNYVLLRALGERPDDMVVTVDAWSFNVFRVAQGSVQRDTFLTVDYSSRGDMTRALVAHVRGFSSPSTTKVLLLHDVNRRWTNCRTNWCCMTRCNGLCLQRRPRRAIQGLLEGVAVRTVRSAVVDQ